ncbi:MAG TPA: hypothetical protein VK358_18260 [Longimicrobium sp.]|nr:hypothetical protein [Longimicrobium sp.]
MSDAFAHLSLDDRLRAESLAVTFRGLGAGEPEAWALSEVEDGIPQLARFVFLRRLWRGAEEWTLPPAEWFAERAPDPADEDDAEDEDESAEAVAEDEADAEPAFLAAQQAVQRILAAGADPEDLKEVARAVFLHATFDALQTVDEGYDPEAGEGLPGWLLTEVGGDLMLTGRMLDKLHEDLFTTEP